MMLFEKSPISEGALNQYTQSTACIFQGVFFLVST